MSDQPQEKKLFVDEDWKSQVQAEKEALKEKPSVGPQPETSAAESKSADAPLPPASLGMLITSLATQAMVSLGLLPNPISNQMERLPNQAKHLIDTLGVLEEKTTGNRTAEESELLEDTLYQLRMAYVAITQNRPPS